MHAEALVVRSRLHTLINQDEASKRDIKAAYQILPEHPDVLLQHAQTLLDTGNAEGAVDALRKSVASGVGPIGQMILASLLNQSGKPAEQVEAQGIFSELATHRNAPYQPDAAIYGLKLLVQVQKSSDAGEYLEKLRAFCTPTLLHVLEGILANSSGERERAISSAEAAQKNITRNTTRGEIRALADLLETVGLYQQSLQQWEKILISGVNDPDLRKVLACAERVGRHDIILKILKQLRESGVFLQDFLQYEISLLAYYDPDEAITLLLDYTREYPADKIAQLNLSTIAYRLGRMELVRISNESLPSAEDIPPEWMEPLIRMIQAVKNPHDAVEFAYKLLKVHFSQPEAHMSFLLSMGLSNGQKPDIGEVTAVTLDCAVSYSEQGDKDNLSWIIIEDNVQATDLSKYEIISPHSPFGQMLLGRKEGDEIVLNPSAIQDRMITIESIVHKYIFIFNDILERWQIRFPDRLQVQQVRERNISDSTSVEVPFASILRMAQTNSEYVEKLLSLYDGNPIPIHVVATKLGLDEISTSWSLANDRKRPIRCAEPGKEEENISILRAGSTLVIDSTALATVLHLDLEAVLSSMPNSVQCSYGIHDDLNRFLDHHKHASQDNLGYRDDRVLLLEISEDVQAIRLQIVTKKIETIKSAFKLKNARALASLDQKAREHLSELFGNATSEAIANATMPGVLLWTDDMVVSYEAQRMLGVKSISTPVLLGHWYRGGALTYQQYCQACARLLAWNYGPTPVSVDILIEAGKMANWNADKFPLDGALDWFGRDVIPRDGVAIVASRFIPSIYCEIALPLNRETLLSRLLEQILQRKDGLSVIKIIRRYLPGCFGLNALGLMNALAAISTWLASRQK